MAAPGTPSGNCGRPGGLPPGSSPRCSSGSSSDLARSSGGRMTAPLDVLLNVCEFTGWCLSTLSRPRTIQGRPGGAERHRRVRPGAGGPGGACRGRRGAGRLKASGRAPASGACHEGARCLPAPPPEKDGPPGPVRPSGPRTPRRRDLCVHCTAYPAPAPPRNAVALSRRRHPHPLRAPGPARDAVDLAAREDPPRTAARAAVGSAVVDDEIPAAPDGEDRDGGDHECAPGGSRTPDQEIRRLLLYPLSY